MKKHYLNVAIICAIFSLMMMFGWISLAFYPPMTRLLFVLAGVLPLFSLVIGLIGFVTSIISLVRENSSLSFIPMIFNFLVIMFIAFLILIGEFSGI